MKKPKKMLLIFTLSVFILLIACTVLSKFISVAIMPVVEVIKPVEMEISTNGVESEMYSKVIPCGAIISGNEKNYVYTIEQRQDLFGIEYYTKFVEVEIIAVNDLYAAIGGWMITGLDDVVISSSDNLTAGETVRVTNK